MKPLLSLVLLGLVVTCTAVSPPVLLEPMKPRVLACDDPETEQAANIAVEYINEHTLHGYRHKLNRIEKVTILPRRPHGEIFMLELDLLETDCHVTNPKPLANCTVRGRTEHAVEGDCDVRMLKDNEVFSVLATKCHSSPDSAEDIRKLCPDCNVLSSLSDPGVVRSANTALTAFNQKSNTGYTLLEISRGFHTHLPVGVHVEFAIAETNCSAQDVHDHVKDCHVLTGEQAHFGFCKASVIKKPAPAVDAEAVEVEETSVACEIYSQQPKKAHTHLAEHHYGKKIPSPGGAHTVLDLVHSHNDTHASHESAEAPAAVPLVKRSVVAGPGPQLCPGKIRHFSLD